ncbi:MAG: DUF4190 domain-containing protein [Planctomycetaceae bacterium]|nr:DUF4190 domain-containing protein [Planctomycetaceae bacterium]
MQCSACEFKNSEGARQCAQCGQILSEPAIAGRQGSIQPVQPRNSRFAVASFVMGLLSLLCVTWPLCGPLAIVFGLVALIKINNQQPNLKGSGIAVTGISAAVITGLIFFPAFIKVRNEAMRLVCGVNMKGLSCALTVYAYDYQGRLPAANWCDLLIEEADVSPKSLICPASKDIQGECSFAMNKHVVEKDLERLPDETVVLFETNIGLNDRTRTENIQSRRHFKMASEYKPYKRGRLKVHANRFNQYGGPEDVLFRHKENGREGCLVLFANGYIKFVTEDEINSLKWIADEQSRNEKKEL